MSVNYVSLVTGPPTVATCEICGAGIIAGQSNCRSCNGTKFVRLSLKIVALLESMWGWRGHHNPGEEAPRFFHINPDNLSGRRLYALCGDATLAVTNSCRTVQATANHHGVPDPEWVKENLSRAQGDGCDLFLICGTVAQKTYAATGLDYPNVILMDHPAARRWTGIKMAAIRRQIAEYKSKEATNDDEASGKEGGAVSA